jgi:hypothetical protein
MGERKGACRVFVGKSEEKNHLEDLSVDGRIILKCMFKKWKGSVGWIDLAQDRDSQRALMDAVINLRFP